jgi:hypothetical protein
MPLNDREKLNRIEEMKRKLFSPTYKLKTEHHEGFTQVEERDVPDSWERQNTAERVDKFFAKTSMFKRFFIFSAVFFAVALGYAAYTFYVGGNTVSNSNIDIGITGNSFTAGGESLPLVVSIANRNNTALELVDMIVEYPKNSGGTLTGETERTRQSLGTIPAGAVRNENIDVTLFGQQGSTEPVHISIEYRVEGSNAIFVKDKMFEVNITSTPITLTLDGPSQVSPNQDISLNIKAALNSTKPARSILAKVDYPPGFQFESATPAPSFGNNVWNFGDISPGGVRSISLVGKMIDVSDGEQKTFHVTIGSQSDSDKSAIGLIFNAIDQVVAIQKPFIDAKLYINGVYQSTYAVSSKNGIQADIHWVNNLDAKINDLSITAKISGNGVDRNTIVANSGTYNSSQNNITWDRNSKSEFASVNPGTSGVVSFSMSPASTYNGSGVLGSPMINVDVSITGKQAVEGNALQEIDSGESKSIRIISDVGFASKLLYFSGPFKNTGPIPPSAEKDTTYTVTWTLSNTTSNVSKTQVTATLPPWVSFVGSISPAAENLSYDPSSKQIVWNVGALSPSTGITNYGREVSFQVTFTPSLSQVGSTPTIVNSAVLTGHDDFANVNIRVNKGALDSTLRSDPLAPVNASVVVQ